MRASLHGRVRRVKRGARLIALAYDAVVAGDGSASVEGELVDWLRRLAGDRSKGAIGHVTQCPNDPDVLTFAWACS